MFVPRFVASNPLSAQYNNFIIIIIIIIIIINFQEIEKSLIVLLPGTSLTDYVM
jgi:hypothetical protein